MADDKLIIVAGQEIDVEKMLASFIDIPDEVEVILPDAENGVAYTMRFKTLPRKSELDRIIQEGAAFYKALTKNPSKGHPWYSFWPQSMQEYIDAKAMAELSIEPKLSIEMALQIQRNASVARAIMEQIEKASKTVPTQWLALMTEEKKTNFSETHSEESA